MEHYFESSHILGAVLAAICTLCFCVIVRRLRSIVQIKDAEIQNLRAENAKIKKKKDNATSHLKAKANTERRKEDEICQLKADLNNFKRELVILNLEQKLVNEEKDREILRLNANLNSWGIQPLQQHRESMESDKDSEISTLQERVSVLEFHLSRLDTYKLSHQEELIRERKKEKRDALLKKHRDNLMNILFQRVSGVNVLPFPEGAFERLKTINLWEKVLGYIDKRCDVTSAAFTSKTFSDLLDGRRKLLLLPEVINVYRTRAEEAFEDCDLELRDAWCRDWKLVCFKARCVCRAWKEIADFILFDSDFCKDDWFISVDSLQSFDPKRIICLLKDKNSMDQILSLLSRAETPSPLIRDLHVWIESLEVNQNFVELMEFLKTHGKAVWFFQLRWSCDTAFVDIYEKLTQILTCLSNLKGFKLDYTSHTFLSIGDQQDHLRILNEHTFPVLDSLQHLQYSFNDDNLLLRVLRNCVNLKSVVVRQSDDYTYTQELAEAFAGLTLERYEGLLTPILKTDRVQWPLKHLTVDGELEGVRPVEFFSGIQCFQETLQQLWMYYLSEVDSAAATYLHFPNLQVIRFLNGGCGEMQIDHLLQIKSLKKMIVDLLQYEDENSIIKISRHFEDDEMDQSRIWEFFPNLMRFNLVGRAFRRPSHPNHSFYNRISYMK